MDNKRTIIVVLAMMALILVWKPAWDWGLRKAGYNPDYRPPIASTDATNPTTQPTTFPTSPTTAGVASSSPTSNPTISAAAVNVAPATQPSVSAIGSPALKDPAFPMEVKLDPRGASIAAVTLNDYKRSVDSAEPYIFQMPYEGFDDASRVLATRSLTVNGTTIDTLNQNWSLVDNSRNSATYAIDLQGPDGAPIARVIKKYEAFGRDAKDQGGGYELRVTQTVENKSGKALEFATTFNGTNAPPQELDRGSDRSIVGGYEAGNAVYLVHAYVESFGAKQKTKDYTKSDKNDYPLLWAGVSSVYFNAIVRPEPLDAKSLSPSYIEKVEALSLNPDESNSTKHHVVTTFKTKPLTVNAGESLTLSNRVFVGPKLRKLLKNDYYAMLPRGYDATLVMTGGFCGFCTFQWLINILVWLLNIFHWILFKDWGLAIIALVCLVRFILHPVTKRSQINMSKMSKFGPEMEKLKEKYKDDKEGLNRAMMGFYKEHGATPLLGCLPMFLQTPIWIALWSALQSTFELRQAPFLHFGSVHLTWIKDLSQPDHLITLSHPIQIFFLTISGLNLLPLLMGAVFFIQQRFTPKPAVMTPEQEQQQKMMQWMSVLIFPLMLYGGPSGLNLYILTSTCIGIIESKIVRDHIKQREEAEKAGKVIIDAGKKFGRGGKDNDLNKKPAAPKTGLRGMLAALQEKAEQVRRDQDRRDRGKA